MYHDSQICSVRIPSVVYLMTKERFKYLGRSSALPLRTLRDGFTLLEVLIVLVIIAIASMTVIPMMSSAATVQVRAATDMITADIEYAKSIAISRGQNYSLLFDKNMENYRIKDQAGNVIAHPVKKGFDYIIDFRNDSRLNKVDIANVSFDATSEIKFDYLGSPYNGNNNPLNSGVITLQAGGATVTITVEPITGFITVTN